MIRQILFDGSVKKIGYTVEKGEDKIVVTIPKETDSKDIKYIEFEYYDKLAFEGDEGYIIIPNGGMLCGFKGHEDGENIASRYEMPIFGAKTKNICFLAIVTGMPFNYSIINGRKDGRYYVFPRFDIEGDPLYEDIKIEYYMLKGENADYSGMARKYREYQLTLGGCEPLSEKIKKSPEINYAKDAVAVRIRLGWKPCPPPIKEQTLENEPEVINACDFNRVGEILDEFKRQGIEKAEICLVGWNAKGHDGRWPQAFPVCEELGGEEALRKLIKKAQSMGYQIVCHTNSTDTYTVSEMWNEDDLLLRKDGSRVDDGCWSGGQMYQICPQVALEQAKEVFPKVADLGFRGIHYIDVMNIVHPRKCYNEKHPLNVGQTIKVNREIMKLARDTFGGYSSEGGYDFGAKYQDYALNLCYYGDGLDTPLCDEKIPLWQLVYHGIIMGNHNLASGVNYSVFKDKAKKLKVIEYGSRPTFYYYWKFTGDWENAEHNLICNNQAELEESVGFVLDGAKLNEQLSFLQTEFMEKHKKIADGIYEIVYSDGTVVTVNYNDCTCSVIKADGSEIDVNL